MENYLKVIVDAIEDKMGEDICIRNIGQTSSIADYFVIASADNERKVKAIADHIEEKMEEIDYFVKSKEGYTTLKWVLMDYGDVIIHIFTNEERDFFNLDRLWKDAPLVEME